MDPSTAVRAVRSAIEKADEDAFEAAMQNYSCLLNERRCRLTDEFRTVEYEIEIPPIDTTIESILPETDERDDEALWERSTSIPIFIAIKMLTVPEGSTFHSRLAFIRHLIEKHNADINNEVHFRTPLMACYRAPLSYFILESSSLSEEKCREAIFSLVDWGAALRKQGEVHTKDDVLFDAVTDGNPVCFHLLLERGARFKRSKWYQDALHIAIFHRRYSIVASIVRQHRALKIDLRRKYSQSDLDLYDPKRHRYRGTILHSAVHRIFEDKIVDRPLYSVQDTIDDDFRMLTDLKNSMDPNTWKDLLRSQSSNQVIPYYLVHDHIIPKLQEIITAKTHFFFNDQFERLSAVERTVAERYLDDLRGALECALKCREMFSSVIPHLDRRMAVAMSAHRRLGANSRLRGLDDDVLRTINAFSETDLSE
jgi:hypothetical protein